MGTLALLDGHSLAYRAFYALPEDLTTSSGQPTNSVYGFTSMLLKLLSDHHPDAVAVAWDTPVPTFRKEAYEPYKAQRAKAPDTFRRQLPLIREVVDSLGFPQLEAEGFEADDVIATIAARAEEADWRVIVVTGDRDAFQLIDDHVTVLYTRRGISDIVVADAAWVEARYGIPPSHYVDYAALRGDPSDNLPGVPGVGEKTAARLIGAHGTLEGVYEHLADLTPRLRENLAANREQVFLNRHLMRLRREVPLSLDVADLADRTWDRDRTQRLFESLEFKVLWERLVGLDEEKPPAEVLDVATRSVVDPEEISRVVAGSPLVLEAVWEEDTLAGVTVAEGADHAAFIPVEQLHAMSAVLSDPDHPKVLHDAKPFIRALLERGIGFEGLSFDCALAAYLISPASRSYSLAHIADTVLGVELESVDAAKQGTLDFGGGPDIEGAGRRAIAVARVAEVLGPQLEARGERELLENFELPLVGVLARMEAAGIGVDRAYLERLGADLREDLAGLESDIYDAAGTVFNINSTGQLREVLFDNLGLPVLKKTPKGAPSTDQSVLKKLATAHPVVALLLRYRELEKLRSTYVDGYLPLIGEDGRIHTRFNQMGAATGRLSSDRPNLQNIPVRSETGRMIRRAFVPKEGWKFIVADYSQIELRVLAHLSGDPGLVEAFEGESADIHAATAARVFGVDPSSVTAEMRRRAKAINFGLLYGMEAYGLAERLEISREEAAEHIETYFTQFPQVKAYLASVVSEARTRGYTETMFGRRRYLPELSSDNYRIRQMGERMALNAPVQGSAADIIKKAMIDLDAVLASMRTRLLLQIHDELVVEAPPDEWEHASSILRRTMEDVVQLRIPLKVELASGFNLAECKV
ncbi:MAG TPA: DNA polymerase I [Actinobacteria bacterium]|nr:DNA polymerase I [Actinomycetota bacterium]